MNSAVDPFLIKKLLKKEFYGSREQCIEPTEQCHSSANLVVNEMVGPVYSAQDSLASLCSHASQLKKKEKRKRKRRET